MNENPHRSHFSLGRQRNVEKQSTLQLFVDDRFGYR